MPDNDEAKLALINEILDIEAGYVSPRCPMAPAGGCSQGLFRLSDAPQMPVHGLVHGHPWPAIWTICTAPGSRATT